MSSITGGAFNSDITLYEGSTTNNKVHFYAGGSEQMTLSTTGLGIGATTPAHQLTVGGNTSDGQAVTIRGYSNTPASWKGGGALAIPQHRSSWANSVEWRK